MRRKIEKSNLIYNPAKRLLTILLSIVVLFCAVGAKFVYVMLVQGKELQLRAMSEWVRDVPTDAARGEILDRNGIVLASNTTKYTVYVRSNDVTDMPATVAALCEVFGYEKSDIEAKLSKRASEITVAKSVDKDKMSRLQAYGLSGVLYAEDNFRYYPFGDFMTQVLGFTGADGNGQTGIEAYYDKYLTGVDGAVLNETDLVGRSISKNGGYYLPSVAGMNVTTTLDASIQRIVSNAVHGVVKQYNPKSVACVVMNYQTGEIAALCEYPSFDLNNVPRDDLSSLFSYSKSFAVSAVYEPGSTFKILTAAAALDTGAVSVSSRYYCGGSMMVDGQKIKCWKYKGHGSIDFAEGVQQSCNCVFMNSALAMGKTKFYDYLSSFGLTKKTGVDMTGETSGIFIAEDDVKNVDLARIGFGQAVAVTPIGLLSASSAVVNGGTRVQPHLLKSVDDVYSAQSFANEYASGERVIRSDTSSTMRTLLQSVVTGGSGKGAYVAGYDVAGKTGTAQKYENGKIAQGKYYSSFLGFSLENEAPYGVLLIVDEPQGYVYYGSIVAAPKVGEIFAGVFDYLSVAPHFSGEEAEMIGEKFALGNYVGMSIADAKHALQALGLYVETDGEGDTVTAQYPLFGAEVDKRNAVCLYTS